MEIILLVVTIGSLMVALVMSAAAWRVAREERARSAARVAALGAAAASEGGVSRARAAAAVAAVTDKASRAPWPAARVASVASARPAAPAAVPAPPSAELVLNSTPLEDEPVPLGVISPIRTTTVGSAFLSRAEERAHSGGRQRLLVIAASALLVVLAGGAYWTMAPSAARRAAVEAASTSPLELISLRHERRGSRLSVSGLVRNPAGGSTIESLNAVVLLFDDQGTLITSSKAGVDFKKLTAGDETPFVISLDAPTTVARYRVSFRTDDGIVPHVDRRGQEAVASAIAPAAK